MQNLYSHPSDLVSLTDFLWHHKRKMFAVWLCGIALTLVFLALAPRKYQSEAKLYIQLGRESVTLDPTATTGQIVSVAETRESEVYAVQELLRSRMLSERIVQEFGPDVILERSSKRSSFAPSQWLASLDSFNLNPLRVYSVRDKAITALRKNLGVTAASKTSIVTVSYEAKDPKLAQKVLDWLLDSARDEHLRTHRTKGSQEFFVQQAKLQAGRLSELEQQLRDLKTQTGLASIETQRELQLKMIDALEADLVRARADQKAAEAEVLHRQDKLTKIPEFVVTARTTGAPQSTGQTLREKLYDLEIREQELASKLTKDHPLLQQIRDQVGMARKVAVQEMVPDQVTKGLSETYQAADMAMHERQVTLAAQSARTQTLEKEVAHVQSELEKLNNSELEINRLEREIDLAQTNYRKYAENLEEARINQELQDAKISSLNIMQAPSFSETPVSPQPLITLMVGFVLSTFGAVGTALIVHNRTSPRRAEAVAAANGSEVHPLSSSSEDVIRRAEVVPMNPR